MLLALLTEDFSIANPEVDETLPDGPVANALQAVAERKARAVEGDIVLAGDTIGAFQGQVLGKPADTHDARAMLTMLSGASHAVVTGLAVRKGDDVWSEAVTTEVTLSLDASSIDAYLASGDWRGKAGGYGIQDALVRDHARIDGPWSNVVGLPLAAAARLLQKAGVATNPAPDEATLASRNPF